MQTGNTTPMAATTRESWAMATRAETVMAAVVAPTKATARKGYSDNIKSP